MAYFFIDPSWVVRLCYLADIFAELNNSNLMLQGRDVTVFDTRDHIRSFRGKLQLWARRVKKSNVSMFPTLDGYLVENTGAKFDDEIKQGIIEHISQLDNGFGVYFPDSDNSDGLEWIRQPFLVPEDSIHDDDYPAKEKFIDLRTSALLKMQFASKNAISFWIDLLPTHEDLSRLAILILTQFATTWLCKSGFSVILGMRMKARNILNVSSDARLVLSVTSPQIEKLATELQQHMSH